MKKFLFATLTLLSAASMASESSRAGTLRYDPELYDQIQLDADVGRFKIEGGGEGVIETHPGALWSDTLCELYAELDGHVLKVRLGNNDKKNDATPEACTSLVLIRVPSNKNIEIKGGQASFSIDQMIGKAKISLKKGELAIHSDLAELEVNGNEVTVTSAGLIAKTSIELDQKNLRLEVKKLGTSPLQRVSLDISQLKTEISFPTLAKVKTRLSGDGIQARAKSEFSDPLHLVDPESPDFELRINSDSGSVGIRKI